LEQVAAEVDEDVGTVEPHDLCGYFLDSQGLRDDCLVFLDLGLGERGLLDVGLE
jgi:hypothetical protein